MATGELRATMALTEPGGGSDLQNISTVARPDGEHWVISGSKTWITNARRSSLIALLCKTDPTPAPARRDPVLLVESPAEGLSISRIYPLGYKGVESRELSFQDCRVPISAVLAANPEKDSRR